MKLDQGVKVETQRKVETEDKRDSVCKTEKAITINVHGGTCHIQF